MRIAATMIKFTIPPERAWAETWAIGSNDTWKDTVMRAQFGTLFKVEGPNGEIYFPAGHPCPPIIPSPGDEMPWTIRKRWSFAVDGAVANIDHTDTEGDTEWLVIFDRVTTSAAGFRIMQLSTDAGASYYTALGNYNSWGTGGVSAAQNAVYANISSTTAALSGATWIPNLTLGQGLVVGIGLPFGNAAYQLIASQDPVDAIRVKNTAGNLAGGAVTILGR